MNTHESYVSLETARLLKEAGFDWKINHYYLTQNGKTESKSDFRHPAQNYNEPMATMDSKSFEFEVCSRPTLDVAQRWLREEQGFLLSVELAENDYDALWYWSICRFCNNEGLTSVDWYGDQWLEAVEKQWKNEEQSYEQALEAGIQKCLTILLEEKK